MPGGGNLRSERYRKRERTARSAHARHYYTRSLVLDDPPRRGATPRARCQSAPKVMDNHSRSASPRESARPQHRPPSPPSPLSPPSPPGAFDNRAYQHDDPNHNDSFTSRHVQNGHSKEQNGDTKTLEAVNLELINLQPKNGNSKKKDVEVDMNASNPYDEYFVPVNEHRKYMRGEKLYVTADKRGEKGGCRRPLCWTLAALLAVAVVAVAALAATGVLFTSSPTPVEQYNSSISSARALGGIGQRRPGDDRREHDHHQHAHHDQSDPTTLPIDVQSDEDTINAMDSDETSDSAMYVPRTIEGELKIDNEEFRSSLTDPESDEYKAFSESFSSGLKQALFSKDAMGTDDNEFFVEVIQLRNGSVIVTYRIHWKPKLNSKVTENITANQLKSSLGTYLSKSHRMISTHHVADDKIAMRRVLDMCQINKNNCDYGCEFDETTLEFTCTCPQGQMIDINNPRSCVLILEPNPVDDNRQKESPLLDFESNSSTIRSTTYEEEHNTDSQRNPEDKNIFDWKETSHVMQETTTESDPDLKFSHIFGRQSNEENHHHATDKPEGHAEKENHRISVEITKPETTSEPKASSEPEPTSEPKPGPAPEPTSEPEPTAVPEPALETKHFLEPIPSAEPEPMSEPAPTVVPEPSSNPKLNPEHLPSLELQPTSEPELTSEPEPTSEPETASEPEPTSEPEPSLEPESISESEPSSEPEPNSNPEPPMELAPTTESITYQLSEMEHQSIFESKTTVKSNSERETTITPEPKPEAQPKSVLTSESHLVAQSNVNINPAPEPEPTSEPKLKSNQTSEPETASEPKPENNDFNYVLSQTVLKMTTSPSPGEEPITEKTELESHKYQTFSNLGLMEQTYESDATSKPEQIVPSLFDYHDSEIESKSDPDKPDSMEYSTVSLPIITSTVDNEVSINSPEKNASQEINDATTSRISISEVHIINEPSYEANPEIVSILRESKKPMDELSQIDSTTDVNNYYSDNDWLEDVKNMKALTSDKSSDSELIHITEPKLFTDVPDVSTVKLNNTSKTEYDLTFSTIAMSGSNTPNVNDEETTTASTLNMHTSTTFLVNNLNDEILSVAGLNNTLHDQVNTTPSNKGYNLHNILDKTIDNNGTQMYNPTTEKIIFNEHSLQKQAESTEEKQLVDALENNGKIMETKTTTEEPPYDNMDITFDSINMLFNRSSKSINKQNDTGNSIATTEVAFYKDSTTTDSDWLSEPVTEINYEEAMYKLKQTETTETNDQNINDLLNHGTTKDDFEPDYLVNMGSSNNKMTEPDMPLYGMVHDYDNEEARVKRVNNESHVAETRIPQVTIETTTLSKITDHPENRSSILDHNNENNSSLNNSEPAPVWEVSDSDRHDTQEHTEQSKVQDESLLQITNKSNNFESTSQKINNFNVTIYEISTQNGNHTFPVTKHVNSQSAEYDDHEIEMNPFLPEIENNKSLVKKLQEGHDLEPTNLNETQNENIEDHSINTERQPQPLNNYTELPIITHTNTSTVTEGDTILDELLMNVHTESRELNLEKTDKNFNDTTSDPGDLKIINDVKDEKDEKEKEYLPISTFLIDTDDLDKEHTTEYRSNVMKNNLDPELPEKTSRSTQMTDGSDEYLSVLPIPQDQEKEIPKKNFRSDLELNDISDSPKKSARRTLDLTK